MLYISRSDVPLHSSHHQSFDVTHTLSRSLVREQVVKREVRVAKRRLLEPYIGTCKCWGSAEQSSPPLLLGEDNSSSPTSSSSYVAPHWNPRLSFRHVLDFSTYPISDVPPLVAPSLVVQRDTLEYVPILFDDTLVSTSDKFMVLNKTITSLPLQVSISSCSRARWLLSVLMEQSISLMVSNMGANDKDGDDIRKLVTETNPVFLLCVVLISSLHLLFDVLAFRNEISFWKNLDSRRGISTRAQQSSLVSQIIIFIYLYHNESSLLILLPAGFSIFVGIFSHTTDRFFFVENVSVECQNCIIIQLNQNDECIGHSLTHHKIFNIVIQYGSTSIL